jgi:F0F1-type ATP synthase membrane subunit b/b'
MKLTSKLALFGVLLVGSGVWPLLVFTQSAEAQHAPAPPPPARDHAPAMPTSQESPSKIGAPQIPPMHPEPVTSENVDGEHASGENAGHHGHWPPPGINWTDFSDPLHRPPFVAMLINFAILAGLYYFLGRKPIAQALKTRRAAVAKEIEEAQRMKAEAEARAKQYQAKLGRLEEELTTAKQALIEAGRGERDRIVKDAEEKAARMQKDATFRIEQEMRQIRQELWRDTVEIAVTAAEDLLKKRITPADQERLAEDYLAELAGESGGKPGGSGGGGTSGARASIAPAPGGSVGGAS